MKTNKPHCFDITTLYQIQGFGRIGKTIAIHSLVEPVVQGPHESDESTPDRSTGSGEASHDD